MSCSADSANAGDSRLIMQFEDYAYLDAADFQDFDYSKGFSVEAWFRLRHQAVEGRYGSMVSKGRRTLGPGGWVVGATEHDYFETFGHSANSTIFSKDQNGTKVAGTVFPGIAGSTYVVMTWDADGKTLTTSINGVAQSTESPDIEPTHLTNEQPFVLNGNVFSGGPPFGWGGRTGEYYLVRLWNRRLSESERETLYTHIRNTSQHALPAGFSHQGLVSEWRMDATCDSRGQDGTTHLCDRVGTNHLELSPGARLDRADGELHAVNPPDGDTAVGPSIYLEAAGGLADIPASLPPLQYFFEIDEVSTFNSPALKESGWLPHQSEWQPVLKPDQRYFWRVNVRDSSSVPQESGFTETFSFRTRPPKSWYVRPSAPSGTYRREDGSDYANAFNGFRAWNLDRPVSPDEDGRGVVWGPGGVEAGDTLFIAGKHFVSKHTSPIVGNMGREGTLFIGADGYSMDHPITLRMDAPEERGEVWNFGRRAGLSEEWNGPDANGVYYADFLGSAPRWPLAADVDTRDAQIMKKATDTTWADNPGRWFIDGNRLYVKMPDGGQPGGRVFEAGLGAKIEIERRSFIRVQSGNFYGVSFEDYLGEQPYAPDLPPRSHHIVFQNCRFEGGSNSTAQITLHAHNDYWEVRNCSLHNYKNGIYGLNYPDLHTADHVTIEKNDIRYMANEEYGYGGSAEYSGDAHAIGVQNGSDWAVINNFTQDTGTAIEFWGGITQAPTRYMENHLIARNWITETHDDRFTLGTGIAISGQNGDSMGQRTNIRVIHNVILNAGNWGIGSNNPDPLVIANNTIYNSKRAGIGILVSGGDGIPKGSIMNNLIIDPADGMHLYLRGTGGTDWSNLSVDHNCYHSDNGSVYLDATLGRGDLDLWRSRTGFDLNSRVSGVTVKSIQYNNFALRPESPCIDLGSTVPHEAPIYDRAGTLVYDVSGALHGSAIDAGALEYALSPSAIPAPKSLHVAE